MFDLCLLSLSLISNPLSLFFSLSFNNLNLDNMQSLCDILRSNTSITHLNVANNALGPEGMHLLCDVLRTNSKITVLGLARNNLGLEGVKVLCEVLHINRVGTILDLTGNSLGADGMRVLCDVLQANASIVGLHLANNSLGLEGVQMLCKALRTNTTIVKISLENNNIGQEGMGMLCDALRINSTITELRCSEKDEDGNMKRALLALLSRNNSFPNICKRLAGNDPWLTNLEMGGWQLMSERLQCLMTSLRGNTCLRELDLSSNSLNKEGIHLLCGMLQSNSTITRLNLANNDLDADAVCLLWDVLRTNTLITALDLKNNSLRKEGVQMLCEVLRTNATLKDVNLSTNFIGPEGIRILCHGLQFNTTIEHVHLLNNGMDAETEWLLGAMLQRNAFQEVSQQLAKNNPRLTNLEMDGWQLLPQQVHTLAANLGATTHLREMNLNNNQLSDKAAVIILRAVANHPHLQVLKMASNRIVRFQGLVETLGSQSAMAVLDVSNNKLDFKGYVTIAHFCSPKQVNIKVDTSKTRTGAPVSDQRFKEMAALARSKYLLISEGGGVAPVHRAKLFVCGPAESGKTTLVRRLGASTTLYRWLMSAPEKDERTIGVDVVPLTLGKDGHFSIWDFAGQSEFYVTHELFLSDDSAIFLVVISLANPREERMKDLLYWLRFIAGRKAGGNKSKVVVVCTHPDVAVEDKCTSPIFGEWTSQWAMANQSAIRDQFANVLDVYETWFVLNVRSYDGKLKALLQVMRKEAISQLQDVPKSIVGACERLMDLREHHRLVQIAEFFQGVVFAKQDLAQARSDATSEHDPALQKALLR